MPTCQNAVHMDVRRGIGVRMISPIERPSPLQSPYLDESVL